MSRNRVRTDADNNGYCMVIPCKSHRQDSQDTYRGIIIADYRDRGQLVKMKPNTFGMNLLMRRNFDFSLADGDKIYMNYDQSAVHAAGTGPFYDWERKWKYSYACSNAKFDENHMSFFDKHCKLNPCQRVSSPSHLRFLSYRYNID